MVPQHPVHPLPCTASTAILAAAAAAHPVAVLFFGTATCQLVRHRRYFSSMLRCAFAVAALLVLAAALPVVRLDMPIAIISEQSKTSMSIPSHHLPSRNLSSSFPFGRKRGIGLAERKLRCLHSRPPILLSLQPSAEHAPLCIHSLRRNCTDSQITLRRAAKAEWCLVLQLGRDDGMLRPAVHTNDLGPKSGGI
jgi:hypothetical protein